MTRFATIQQHYAWPSAFYSATSARCLHCQGTVRLLRGDEWVHNSGAPACPVKAEQ